MRVRRIVLGIAIAFGATAFGAQPASAAGPTAIGVDSSGIVYVGFASGGAIARYQGTDGAQLASWGTAGSGAGQLGGVVAIDVAPGGSGNVWILDTNRRVQEFSRTGQYLRGVQLGSCDAGVSPDPLARGGLDVTYDDVFVAHPCANTVLRLRKSDLQTMNTGSASAPKGVGAQHYNSAPEPTRRTYVAQPAQNQALKLQPWFSTDGGVSTPRPADVFVDAFGVLFAADTQNHQIHLYDSNANEFRTLGSPGSAAGQLNRPTAFDVFEQYSDLAGNLFIADYGNNRIQRWNSYGYTFWTAAASDSGGGGAQAPVNTGAPQITGTPTAGQQVTCTQGSWNNSPTGYTYAWLRNGAPIGGANSSTYTIQGADVNQSLTCVVTASNATGSASAASAPVTPGAAAQAPANTAQPTVDQAIVGSTSTCSPGTWTGNPAPTYSYQWYVDTVQVSTSQSYTPTAGTEGRALTCRVTATNSAGSTTATSTPQTITAGCAPTLRRPGVTINDQATFTNTPNVTLRMRPSGGTTWLAANDGSFESAPNTGNPFPCSYTVPWTLPSSGAERLPKTVYVRFDSSSTPNVNYTDDIILDQSAPLLRSATLSGKTLSLTASDKTAGVGKVQYGVSRRGPFTTVSFKKKLKVSAARKAKVVRVIDKAGNYSGWRAVKRKK